MKKKHVFQSCSSIFSSYCMHWNLSAHTQRSPDIRKAYGSCQLQNQKLTGSMRAIRGLPSSFSSPVLDLLLQLNVSKSGVIKRTLGKKKKKDNCEMSLWIVSESTEADNKLLSTRFKKTPDSGCCSLQCLIFTVLPFRRGSWKESCIPKSKICGNHHCWKMNRDLASKTAVGKEML